MTTRSEVENFHEFMSRREMTEVEQMLVQAVAIISTSEAWRDKTPEEVFDAVRGQALFIYGGAA